MPPAPIDLLVQTHPATDPSRDPFATRNGRGRVASHGRHAPARGTCDDRTRAMHGPRTALPSMPWLEVMGFLLLIAVFATAGA